MKNINNNDISSITINTGKAISYNFICSLNKLKIELKKNEYKSINTKSKYNVKNINFLYI